MNGELPYKSLTALVVGFVLLLVAAPTGIADIRPEIAEALERGDSALAIQLLKEQMEFDKGYYLNYYTLGMIYYKQGKCREALEQLQIALDKKGSHWESLYYAGLCHLKLGNLEEACKAMEKGRKKAKDDAHRFENGYGLVMLAEENYEEANRAFLMALVGHEDVAEYHINLGDVYLYQNVPSLAVVEYEKALGLDTASLEVYYHWAEACIDMRDYKCAIEKLQVVLTKDSTHAEAWNRAGSIYYKAARSSTSREDRKDRFTKTVGSYKRYFELSGAKPDSSTVRAYYELAMAYLSLNGFEDAAKYFADVLSIPMEPRDIYFYYGKALWGMQDYERAAQVLKEHEAWLAKQDADFRSGVGEDELYQLLGDAYYYRKPNDFANAITYYRKSLEADPDQMRLLQNVAVGYHSLKRYAEALQYYDRRLEYGVDSSSATIYKNAGLCALNIANSEVEDEGLSEEEGDTGEEAAIDPNVNYYELAVEYMTKYLELVPDDTKTLLLAGNTSLYQLADCESGVKFFTKLLEKDPNDCDAKKSLGYAYFGGLCSKSYDRALGYLKEAYNCLSQKAGACSDVNLVLWIAQCYHLRAADKAEAKEDANDDFKSAFEWYGKVLKCDPSNADAKKGQDDTRFEFVDKASG